MIISAKRLHRRERHERPSLPLRTLGPARPTSPPVSRLEAANERARRKASYSRGKDAGWIKFSILLPPDLRDRIDALSSVIFPDRPERHMAPWIVDRLAGMADWEEAHNSDALPPSTTTIGSRLRLNAVEILKRVGMYEEAVKLARRLLQDDNLREDVRLEMESVRDDLARQVFDIAF